MPRHFHSIQIDLQKCKGCASCVDRCPVKAIRLHRGKAQILKGRCVDCGECVRTCPNQAKTVAIDTPAKLALYPYNIALLAPSLEVFLDTEFLSGQISFEDIRDAFSNMGFDEVFRVARAAEVVTFITEQHILLEQPPGPLLSSSCPAVLKLIQMIFPGLLRHAAPFLSPMEVASRLAKEEAQQKTGLPPEKIGAFFISPCPAKVTETKQPLLTTDSSVDGVIGINSVYRDIVSRLSGRIAERERSREPRAPGPGAQAHRSAAASGSTRKTTRITVSGIHNVIRLLGEIEGKKPVDADFIEVLACAGGCPGGPLNTRAPFDGIANLRILVDKYRTRERWYDDDHLLDIYDRGCFAATGLTLPTAVRPTDRDQHVHECNSLSAASADNEQEFA